MRGMRSTWVVVALGLAACSGPTQLASPSGGTSAKADAPVASAARAAASGSCLAGTLGAELKQQIFQDWAPPASSGVTDIAPLSAPSSDGWMMASQRSPAFSGVALWNVGTNKTKQLLKFEQPKPTDPSDESPFDQARGSFDGRRGVFLVSHNPYSANDTFYSMYAFDAQTGKVKQLAGKGPDKESLGVTTPIVVDGYGVWVEEPGEPNATIMVAELSSGDITRLPRKSALSVEAYKGKLLVDETSFDGPPKWALLSMSDGKEKPLPAVLAAQPGGGALHVSNGGAVAYLDKGRKALWFSPDGVAPAQRLATPKQARVSDYFSVTDEAIVYAAQGTGSESDDDPTGSYFVDTSTGREVAISTSQYVVARGNQAATVDAVTDKAAGSASLRIVTVKPGQLPTC